MGWLRGETEGVGSGLGVLGRKTGGVGAGTRLEVILEAARFF